MYWQEMCSLTIDKHHSLTFSNDSHSFCSWLVARHSGACIMTNTTRRNNINATIWVRSIIVRQWWTFSNNGMFHAQTARNFLYSTPKLSRQLPMLAKHSMYTTYCFIQQKTYKENQTKLYLNLTDTILLSWYLFPLFSNSIVYYLVN